MKPGGEGSDCAIKMPVMSSSTYYKPAANRIDSVDKQSNNRGGMWEDITRSSEGDGKVKREI